MRDRSGIFVSPPMSVIMCFHFSSQRIVLHVAHVLCDLWIQTLSLHSEHPSQRYSAAFGVRPAPCFVTLRTIVAASEPLHLANMQYISVLAFVQLRLVQFRDLSSVLDDELDSLPRQAGKWTPKHKILEGKVGPGKMASGPEAENPATQG